jgi:methyl-accepting chemotaxis protein
VNAPFGQRLARRVGNLRLRGRLLLGLLALASLVAIAGGAGLWVINDIGGTVATFSHTTSPLVEESARLRQQAQRARLTLLELLSRARNNEQAARAKLETFSGQSERGLASISALLKQVEIQAGTSSALAALSEFGRRASEILDAHRSEAVASEDSSSILDTFDGQVAELDRLLVALATQSETLMSEREDRAKTLVQSSRATVDTLGQVLDETFNESYPIVQGLYKLTRYTALVQQAARNAIVVDDDVHLAQVEKQIKQHLATARTLQNRVAARLIGATKVEFGKVREGFANIEKLLLSDAGLLAAHGKAVRARNDLRALRLTLANAQNTYSDELEKIEAAAAQFNDNARNATTRSVRTANKTVGALVAIALVLAVAFAFIFARRMVRPLTRLTSDMRRLASGDLNGDPAVYGSKDEIAEMLDALEVFRDTARRDQAFASARNEEGRRKEARQEVVERYIREFDAGVTQSLGIFLSAASEMRETAGKMAINADETSRQAATVSIAARDTSQDIGTVATAAEELSVSTSEISRQIALSASIAGKALQESERAHAIVRGFTEAAGRIGNVVSLIQDVAQIRICSH